MCAALNIKKKKKRKKEKKKEKAHIKTRKPIPGRRGGSQDKDDVTPALLSKT